MKINHRLTLIFLGFSLIPMGLLSLGYQLAGGCSLRSSEALGLLFPLAVAVVPISLAMSWLLARPRIQLEEAVAARTRDLHLEISHRKNTEERLRESRRELQEYVDQMSTMSAKLGTDRRILMVNRIALLASGLDEKSLVGMDFLAGRWFQFDAEVAARVEDAFSKAASGEAVSYEEKLWAFHRIIDIRLELKPVKGGNGRIAYIVAEGQDITALKDAQASLYEVNESLEESVRERTENLRAALREKEMLLKEVHHRVKNNLQIISSLLSLQSIHVRDPQVAGILMASRDRVKSMALVHERLYSGEELGKVGFSGYIRDVTAQLVRSFETEVRGIVLDFDLEDVTVGLTQAIPCGLAVHELVANSLKHAFPRGRSSTGVQSKVGVGCRMLPAGELELSVEDNGVGLPEGFDPRKSRSLGLQLVFTLVRQLKGGLQVERDGGGTRFRITVPGVGEKEVNDGF